jgi:hypothetical protein
MPGSDTSTSKSPGSSPPKSASMRAISARMFLALLRKKPVERISRSRVSWGVRAQSRAVRYFANSAGVTMFTRLSVHWAERMVATASSMGVRQSSSQCASG